MNRITPLLPLVLAAALPACGAQDAERPQKPDLKASAQRFVDLLVKEDFAAAAATFDDVMTKAMPPEKLKGAWTAVVARAGPFQEQLGVEMAKAREFDVAVVTCRFEKGTLDVKVVYSQAGEVTGLWFAPPQASVEYRPPPYVNPDAFEEKEVTVGSGDWPLPGTLTLPKGDGPFPAVVLVHGSGPNDRDETVGANKPFRDLAWGLASRGVAVVRYEKRTKQHALKLGPLRNRLTVKEETVDDAVAAAGLLRATEKIDPSRVFVLGHSLGGMLAPRIGLRAPEIAGFVVLAGNTRPLEDLVLDQSNFFASLDGEVSDDEAAKLSQLEEHVARVKAPGLTASTPAAELLGIPVAYWLDLRGYDPAEAAKQLKQPMLILHGGRDYQVTMADFDGWRQALSSRPNVELKVFPRCNHLFVEGDDPSTPAEYQSAGHVAEDVIETILDWLRRLHQGEG
ncbi:MAG: alpha/beta hydrolase [Planctomycetota bacterium]